MTIPEGTPTSFLNRLSEEGLGFHSNNGSCDQGATLPTEKTERMTISYTSSHAQSSTTKSAILVLSDFLASSWRVPGKRETLARERESSLDGIAR